MSLVHRVWTAVVLLAALGVAGAVVYVVGHKDPVRQAGQTPGYLPAASQSSSGTASSSGAAAGNRVKVVFLGDDYTAAVGASSTSTGWVAKVGDRLGIDAVPVAEAGAGYAATGPQGSTYEDLIGAVVAAKPAVVVVSGGRNDTSDAATTLRAATRSVFARLHSRLPTATIVALAPWWGDSPHPAKLDKVTGAVRSAVQAAGGTYLPLPDPLLGHPEWMANQADPNDRGYAAIAASVTAALRGRLPH